MCFGHRTHSEKNIAFKEPTLDSHSCLIICSGILLSSMISINAQMLHNHLTFYSVNTV